MLCGTLDHDSLTRIEPTPSAMGASLLAQTVKNPPDTGKRGLILGQKAPGEEWFSLQ